MIEPYWPILLGVPGAVFGSFIATVALRWPERRSALAGRSACDGCARTLRWWELVPIVSWVALRGRCARCGGGIAALHPVIELLGLAIGVAAGWAAPGIDGVAGATFGWLLLAAGAVDFTSFRLPNAVTLALAITGLAGGMIAFEPPLLERVIGGIAGFGMLWLIGIIYAVVRARPGLGGGDPKLLGAIGLWIGWHALPYAVMIACLIGLAWAAVGRDRFEDKKPFGTLLAVGAFAMWLVGHWPGGGGVG